MKILSKRVFYFLLLIVTYFVLAACSLQQSSADNQKDTAEGVVKAEASGPVRIQTFQSGATVQNQISERIKIVNTGTSAVALSNVKIRYYIAYQGSASYNFACDYSPVGSGNVKSVFTAMSPSYTGAEAYQEISFAAGAGSLAGGASVELQCRIWKSDWSGIDNSLNYSYNPAVSYADWNKVTLAISGTLSWGIEPGTVTTSSAASVVSSTAVSISSAVSSVAASSSISSAASSVVVSSSRSSVASSIAASSSRSSVASSIAASSSRSSVASSAAVSSAASSIAVSSSSASQGPVSFKIQTYQNGAVVQGTLAERFTIVNTGTSPLVLSNIKIRYYFAFQGYSAYGFACDYTTIGNGNVKSAFASMNPASAGADAYQEIYFTSGAGSLAAGASVELQCRLWKLNWTTIDASLNYSYNPSTSYTDCTKVTGYVNGSLVWGSPPSGSASSSGQSSSAAGLKVLANNKGILLGTALTANNLSDIACVAVTTNEFNCLVAGNEMKFSYLEPNQNSFTYTTADNMVNFAVANGMKMRGHTLLWHSDYQVPQWIKSLDYSLLAAAERNHVSNIIAHFGNKIYCWDVANEIVMDSGAGLRNRTASSSGDYSVWASSLTDDSVIRAAFIQARATATALGITTKLFLNDYNIEEMGNAKTEKFYQIVTNWLASGVPIDGVGFQCHFMEKYTPNYAAIRANIDRFQALGLEVQFTEMDVRIQLPAAQANLDNQASIYGNMMQIALDKKVKTFVIWGVSDKDSWVQSTFPGYGSPLIFDDNYNKKPAYTAIQQKLSQ